MSLEVRERKDRVNKKGQETKISQNSKYDIMPMSGQGELMKRARVVVDEGILKGKEGWLAQESIE